MKQANDLFWHLANQRAGTARQDSSGGKEPKDNGAEEGDLEMADANGEGDVSVNAHKASADAHKASAKAFASNDKAAHQVAAEKHAVAFSRHTMAGNDKQAAQHLDAMKSHHDCMA